MNCIVQAFADSNISKTLDHSMTDFPLWQISQGFNRKFMEEQADLADSDPDFDMYITYLDSPLPLAQHAVYEEYNKLLDTIRIMDKTGED